MKDLEDYYTNPAIIKMLCKHRAGISHKRHKKHMSRDISFHNRTNKITISNKDFDFITIQSLFPTRRNWKKLNQTERLDPNSLTNSLERNQMRLWKSYKIEKYLVDFKGKTPEDWYDNLLQFCNKIRKKVEDISTDKYIIQKPLIFPLPKSNKNGRCIYRPIAKFTLEDKIITSLLSRYLTINFDSIFLDCSYAFRARNNKTGHVPNHHDSIIEILKYRKKYKKLWVSECDIQKFFDTVQHDHLLKIFHRTIEELSFKGIKISTTAIKLFSLFLDSYSFNKDVLTKNSVPNYFMESGVPIGEFGWVKNELIDKYSETYIESFKIGVPQGNAISCFIANLILNNVDKAVKNVDENIFYVRYCDDMVLAHKNNEICKKALEVYKKGISDNYLLYHEPKSFKNYKDSANSFWEVKSKEPYFFGNKYVNERNIPWLSFVGYQINYKGELRVRKSSIKKEISKQISETQRILISLGLDENRKLPDINKYSRKTINQIIFSLQQRLISMSVGRVTIYNYEENNLNQGLCWTNGFHLLNENKIVLKQLKELDKRREQQILYLKRMISHLNKETNDKDDLPKYMEELYFGVPYSYYNHLK
ncbi:reverse transcriptase domain-containing protein [Wenyingzhuangia sp. chi5]|uniref:Reverse transcriptase domain-containing protein n=1 Tax=Wenyingzhuangia gilva TaxID=3057677 RepID=A0ABT8VUQ2_9FLAO|nr:reverse transcriptase domain-containing protein [Wenyingzhuangia sp. chi5]MDO3695694.1 reverse transcriptase domain-containing protein [Wenyingzhuangia sp. chi5]